jgi:hypothetical protein
MLLNIDHMDVQTGSSGPPAGRERRGAGSSGRACGRNPRSWDCHQQGGRFDAWIGWRLPSPPVPRMRTVQYSAVRMRPWKRGAQHVICREGGMR